MSSPKSTKFNAASGFKSVAMVAKLGAAADDDDDDDNDDDDDDDDGSQNETKALVPKVSPFAAWWKRQKEYL